MKNRHFYLIPLIALVLYILIAGGIAASAVDRIWNLSDGRAALFVVGIFIVLPIGALILHSVFYGRYRVIADSIVLDADERLKPGIYKAEFMGVYRDADQLLFLLHEGTLKCNVKTGALSGAWECPKMFVFHKERINTELKASCLENSHSRKGEVTSCYVIWERYPNGERSLYFHPRTQEIDRKVLAQKSPPAEPDASQASATAS